MGGGGAFGRGVGGWEGGVTDWTSQRVPTNAQIKTRLWFNSLSQPIYPSYLLQLAALKDESRDDVQKYGCMLSYVGI